MRLLGYLIDTTPRYTLNDHLSYNSSSPPFGPILIPMKHAIKGALLSGLVFPGMGQIALKHYKKGIVLVLVVFACISYIVMKVVEMASSILERIDINSGAVDINAITNAATQATESSGNLAVNIASLLILACWIYGIVDAYGAGKALDSKKDLIQ